MRFLVHQPTAITNLLAHHVDDGRGRCQACRVANQRGCRSWPCVLHDAATRAATARAIAGLPPGPSRR